MHDLDLFHSEHWHNIGCSSVPECQQGLGMITIESFTIIVAWIAVLALLKCNDTAKNRPNQSFRILLSKNCSLALWLVSVLQFQMVSAFSVGTYGCTCPTVSGIFNTIYCLQLIISVAYSFSSRIIKKHFQDLQDLFSADHYLLLIFIYVCPLKVLPDLIENVRPSYLAIAGVAKVIQDLLEPACNLGIVSTCCNAVTYNICCVIWNAQFMTFYCMITANSALNAWKKDRMALRNICYCQTALLPYVHY